MAIRPTLGIVGFSGSGKTQLAARLVKRLVDDALVVAAIKHTHHDLNEMRRGDTSVLAAAGADPVLLCRAGEAVEFRAGTVRRVAYETVEELRAGLEADVVLIEGLKGSGAWPRLVVWSPDGQRWDDWEHVVAVVAHGPAIDGGKAAAASRGLPFFHADEIEDLRRFLGRILAG